jgi:hypothetical protein
MAVVALPTSIPCLLSTTVDGRTANERVVPGTETGASVHPAQAGLDINTPSPGTLRVSIVTGGWALGLRGLMEVDLPDGPVVGDGVVLGEVVSQVFLPRSPVDSELSLSDTIPNPIETHVNRL